MKKTFLYPLQPETVKRRVFALRESTMVSSKWMHFFKLEGGMLLALVLTLFSFAQMAGAAETLNVPADMTLKEFVKSYPLKPVRSYTFLGTENSTHEVWTTAKRYNKPVVQPDGVIDGWFNPADEIPWIKDAQQAGDYEFGLVDGYLPAVHYVYRKAGSKRVCDMTAFAVDADKPGDVFIFVALLEKEDGQPTSSKYLKVGDSTSPLSPTDFQTALEKLRNHWESFFAKGKQIAIPDPDIMLACKASIIRAMITFTGKRPHYGVRAYGPGPFKQYGVEGGDGFPPTIISLVDCLLDWGHESLAREYLTAYFDILVQDNGRVRYYHEEKLDNCSIAEYGQLFWLVRKCMDRGGSHEWFEHIRPKLECIRAAAWEGAAKYPCGLIAGAGESDLADQVGFYFHNNGWMLRGLRDISPLLGHPEDAERCNAFEKNIQAAIEKVTDRSVVPMFIPPMAEKTEFNTMTPFKTMSDNNFVSYTNYRYWPELLSSRILTKEQMEATIEYRNTHNGESAGMCRFRTDDNADNWPIAEYAAAMRDLGRIDEVRRIFFCHLAGHMTPETWTAYEQVTLIGDPFRSCLPGADYCVPSQLVVPRLAAWLYGKP
jgi:hypothetical protein